MYKMDQSAQVLFDYLRDVLYAPEKAQLDLDKLGDDFKMLGEGMQYFAKSLNETRSLAAALAKGNLSVKLPAPDNEMAAPLKALHASLKHMTWQSQQVAKGDYQQRIDFMGEFAEAFNTMIKQLDHRQRALQEEIQKTKRKTRALEQSNSLLEAITDRILQWIVVMSLEAKEMMFMNRSAEVIFDRGGPLVDSLRDWLHNQTEKRGMEPTTDPAELVLAQDGKIQYYSVISYPIQWKDHNAIAHVITDISAEKEQVLKLENYAYQDTLTSIHNRFFGMQTLREWVDEERKFAICFADLDNLKYVNDNFGHHEGDRYIIQAAQYLLNFDKNAVACRLGGDEFMVLADGFTRSTAETRMDEIRTQMIEKNRKEKNPYLCSLSYGVVEVKDNNEYSASELLGIADERMYQYKRAHKEERRVGAGQRDSEPEHKLKRSADGF